MVVDMSSGWETISPSLIVTVTKRLAPEAYKQSKGVILPCFLGDEIDVVAKTTDNVWVKGKLLSSGRTGIFPLAHTTMQKPLTNGEGGTELVSDVLREIGLLTAKAIKLKNLELFHAAHKRSLPLLTVWNALQRPECKDPNVAAGIEKRLYTALEAMEADPVLFTHITHRVYVTGTSSIADTSNTGVCDLLEKVCFYHIPQCISFHFISLFC